MNTRMSPVVRRRRLALELRRLRTEAGIRAVEVAKELGCSPGKISQMETGRVAVTVPDTRAMLELYGVTGDGRDTLVELARTARQRGWWQPYDEVMHPWFRPYVGLEAEACAVLDYRSEAVPGLLRTEDYLKAMLAEDAEPWSEEQITALVALHDGRRVNLDASDAPTLRFVVDESVLRRQVGGPRIMRAQLDHLLATGKRENITVQVLPFTAGAHPATSGSFTVLEFPQDPGVVYLEYLTGADYLEHKEAVRCYRSVFERLTSSALSATQSAALIRELANPL